jgi:putative oxidoreductase
MTVAYTIGRILIPLLFLVDGIQKALKVAEIASALEARNIWIPEEIVPYLGGMPKYQALGYLIAAVEIVCGLMVLIGLRARWAALVLVVFTACAIVFAPQHFWNLADQAQIDARTEMLKNLAIMGGLLLVVAVGSRPDTTVNR